MHTDRHWKSKKIMDTLLRGTIDSVSILCDHKLQKITYSNPELPGCIYRGFLLKTGDVDRYYCMLD